MGGQTLSRAAVFRQRIRRAVALLGGNMDELPLLRAAFLASSMRDASVQLCWIDGKASPSRLLIRELALDAHTDEVSPQRLADLLDGGLVSTLMLAPTLWRQLAARLWRRLDRTSAYICRRASLPPASVLCCADSETTAAGLLDRLQIVLPEGTTRFTLLRAVPPPPLWLPGMLAFAGCALPPEDGRPAGFASTPGIPELIIRAAPAAAAAVACAEVKPDLLVAGWHQHRLPLPGRWLHPTAWRLSTSFQSDLLLVPLGA